MEAALRGGLYVVFYYWLCSYEKQSLIRGVVMFIFPVRLCSVRYLSLPNGRYLKYDDNESTFLNIDAPPSGAYIVDVERHLQGTDGFLLECPKQNIWCVNTKGECFNIGKSLCVCGPVGGREPTIVKTKPNDGY